MNYPYISIRPLIGEVMDDLKKISATTSYNENDCYTWAVDAARQIGGHNYQTDPVFIDIKRHVGKLPSNFYMVNEISACALTSLASVPSTPFTPGPKHGSYWIATSIMRPADSVTWKHCNRDCINPGINKVSQSYTIKVPPGIIKTSFSDGKVFLNFLAIPVDETGVVMIQDEVNCILAVKNYITMMMIREEFLLGGINANAFNLIKQEWEDYLNLAQQKQKLEGFANTDFLAAQQDARYRKFRYIR